MSRATVFSACLLMTAAALASVETAHAQGQLREERQTLELPVNERLPEELQPHGITYKGLVIRPTLETETRHDTNIFAEANDETSDTILSVRPGISLLKLFNAHRFLAGASAEIDRFSKHPDEGTDAYNGFLRGRLSIGEGWAAPFGIAFDRKARDNSAPRLSNRTRQPVYTNALSARAGIARRFNRLNVGILGHYGHVKNENGLSAGNGSPVIYSDNDTRSYGAELQFRYGFPRGRDDKDEHILYADYKIIKRDYVRLTHDGSGFFGINRDNLEQGILAGFETNYKGIVFANIGTGYIWRNYDDPALESTGNVSLSADVAWNIIPKLTLSLEASRDSVQNNDFIGGYIKTGAAAGLDYELLHNFYVSGKIGYTTYDFSDSENAAGREEEDTLGHLGLRYHHSPSLTSAFGLRHQIRNSTIPENEFERTIFLLSLTGQL